MIVREAELGAANPALPYDSYAKFWYLIETG
jgi:hypothetical protein